MDKLSRQKLQQWAMDLYLSNRYTQKEIASRIGITEATLSKWVAAGNWDSRRISIITTKKEELNRLYMQLSNLNNSILQREAEKDRVATSREADVISKLTAAIRNLETETSIGQIVDVFILFQDFLREHSPEVAVQMLELQDAFIKNNINR